MFISGADLTNAFLHHILGLFSVNKNTYRTQLFSSVFQFTGLHYICICLTIETGCANGWSMVVVIRGSECFLEMFAECRFFRWPQEGEQEKNGSQEKTTVLYANKCVLRRWIVGHLFFLISDNVASLYSATHSPLPPTHRYLALFSHYDAQRGISMWSMRQVAF